MHSICQQIWKTQQWPQDWKVSVFIPISKKVNAKDCSNNGTIALISHARKVILKILQARIQLYVNREIPDVQAAFRKGRGTRHQITDIHWIIKKAREFQKNIYSALLTTPKKAFDSVDHNTLRKILKERGAPDSLSASWETCLQVKKKHLEPDMEQRNGSKLGKKYIKAVYCHPPCLTSMQRTSCEMSGWMKHKLKSRLLGEISITPDMQMTPPLWQKVRRN